MKVFLTSFAANVMDKVVPLLLPKTPKDLPVLFIPTGANPYKAENGWKKTEIN